MHDNTKWSFTSKPLPISYTSFGIGVAANEVSSDEAISDIMISVDKETISIKRPALSLLALQWISIGY